MDFWWLAATLAEKNIKNQKGFLELHAVPSSVQIALLNRIWLKTKNLFPPLDGTLLVLNTVSIIKDSVITA